ncbi:hypothetical protein T02_4949, partial [Trichinella nativa]
LAIEHVILWRYLTHSAAFGEFLVVRKVDILLQSREAVPVLLLQSLLAYKLVCFVMCSTIASEIFSKLQRPAHRRHIRFIRTLSFSDVRYSSTLQFPTPQLVRTLRLGLQGRIQYRLLLLWNLQRLTALLPSKLSSFTDIEDRVAVLVEAVRGFRNGEKAFTSRAEVFDSATVMRSHHSDDKQKDTGDPKRRGEVDIHWNWMHSELVGERYQQLNPSSTRHYTFASSSYSR